MQEKDNDKKKKMPQRRRPRNMKRRRKELYDDEVIEIKSVVKVNKGGRQRRFSATVVVGDKKGKVGIGTGKANEVPDAIRKAKQKAIKNIERVYLSDGRTISHEALGVEGSTKVLLKPAPEGTGIVAGGAVRSVLELAGYKDIVSKSLGARTKKNMADATVKALRMQKSPEHVARLRGKTKEEILG